MPIDPIGSIRSNFVSMMTGNVVSRRHPDKIVLARSTLANLTACDRTTGQRARMSRCDDSVGHTRPKRDPAPNSLFTAQGAWHGLAGGINEEGQRRDAVPASGKPMSARSATR
jgi:hypothetical protein